MKETELAEAVIAWLEMDGWDIYQEVQVYSYSGVCDIIATKGFLVWAIECKLNLTWGLIEQVSRWRTHFRSIAVPRAKAKTRGRYTAYRVCNQFFNLGIIEVNRYYADKFDVHELKPAPLMREYHELAKNVFSRLRPEHKTHAKAGSTRGNMWTPYKHTMSRVKRFIGDNPGCTLKEIMEHTGEGHYAHMKSARASIKDALFTIEKKWCRVDTETIPWRYYLRDDN